RVLDACAAPGGKACYLAEAIQGTGRVFAWELHEHRVLLLESARRRLKLENLRITQRDATEYREEMENTLDAVLLDAPCTGLGVLAQKPDLKYRVKEADVEPIVRQQKKLLDTLCRYVKPGGALVYSTCSLLPEENRMQTAEFLQNHPEFEVESLPETFPESLLHQQTPLGLQLLPQRDGVEGFYIVRLKKGRA
ncbi:MAG: methyltransferase domain-containing protein, partial [Clostridia bacterium]|nr:methyltransferase domain-containing protein [Clostridia bacterium]